MKKILLLTPFLMLFSCTGNRTDKGNSSAPFDSFSTEGKKVTIYMSADTLGMRLSEAGTVEFKAPEKTAERFIYLFADPEKKFQTFIGVGGALTDAAAETFAKLPEASQEKLLKAYYDPKSGIGYSIARTNINSCDFSSDMYTYVEEGDKELKSFSLAHDEKFKMPLIKRAIAAAGGKLNLFASPWSPPAFMKSSNDMLHGGSLRPEYFQSWADYFTKFIKGYESAGIPIWGITIQNEPMAVQKWESCIYFPEEERDFLKTYLGPTMVKAGLGDKKIIVWDHNRDLIAQRARVILDDPEAAKYVSGIGFHWYEDWSGGKQMYKNLGIVHEAYPEKFLLLTEACNGPFDTARYQDWTLGERYGEAMINDFNNGSGGWTDWNIILDEKGGPNHVGNFCFAPVHGNTVTGELVFTPAYSYIGHFSKFIRPGAKRILCAASRSQLLTTGFINEDGTVAIVVMNQSGNTINYNLSVGNGNAAITILPHAIQTLVF
jgi:glucosylceramidase